MAKINGSDLMLFLAKENGTKKSVAFATNHSLDISGDSEAITNKDEGGGKWQSNEVSTLGYTITSESLTSTSGFSYSDIFDLMIARKPVDIIFGLEGDSTDFDDNKLTSVPEGGSWTPQDAQDTPSFKYSGKAVITGLSLAAQAGSKSTMTINLSGTGPLVKTTV